jgi:probable F420-dependent oxidoreductase
VRLDDNLPSRLADVGEAARSLEAGGYAGGWTAETSHDPFLPLTLAAEHTETLELGTGIAVAFARNPMLLANLGYDLQEYSGGRLMMGLGSQIKPHITKRFSMEWSRPAARMREMVEATRAIWHAWNTGERLAFRGDFYTHTLMTPFFDPGPNPHGDPRVFLAAVGPHMLAVTGQVADGWISHPFTTQSYLRDVGRATIEAAATGAGRSLADIEVSLPAFVVTGADETAMAAASLATRQQIAFYASTPAYKGVLDHHGWGEAHVVLNNMSKRGEWDAMADLIEPAMLDELAVVAEPAQVAARLRERFDGLVDRVSLYVAYERSPEVFDPIVDELLAS